MIQDVVRRTEVIRCIHTLAVALKHHLRGERDWSECRDLKQLCAHLPNVSRYLRHCVVFVLPGLVLVVLLN
jgi:hypothetical protein